MSKKVKRLFEGFKPKHYTLFLQPSRDSMRFAGTVTIKGQKTGRPSQRITLHQKDLRVTEATLTRRDKKDTRAITIDRIGHHRAYDELRLYTTEQLYAGSYEITLAFEGKITDGMHGIYPCYYEIDGKKQSLIATQFESHHAREAFPCIDEPEAKAVFDVTIASPLGETVLGNMPVVSQAVKNNLQHTTFDTTPKMPTYLVAFAFGDLQTKSATTKDGVLVNVWATKAHAPEALDFGLDAAKRSIEFFNDYFGVPYPLPKSDHIALPDFSAGAMENWGLIAYREACLLADPKTAPQSGRETVAMVVAHETSHQWFGNLVTMKWWDDLWLNESFANVMEYVAVDALYPEWHIWNSFITQEGLQALLRDSIAGVQAVRTEVRHPDEIASIFDPSIVYAKGGRLLRMLMQYIGEDDFRKGLLAYFTKHAYGNTTGSDLWDALAQASGKDVAAFMNPWLTRSGFPVVHVAQESTNLQLQQEHFLLDPTKTDTTRIWPVALLSERSDVPQLLEKASAIVQLQSAEYVQINQGASGHYIVHYTESKHAAAIAKLISQHKLAVPERLMLLSDSGMLARAGHQSFVSTLQLLEEYANEDQDPVWDIMTDTIGNARRFIDSAPQTEAYIKALIRKLIAKEFSRLGWKEIKGEPVQDIKLRALIISLGVYAEEKIMLEGAIERFASYQKDSDSVSVEFRGIVFAAAVRRQVPGAFVWLQTLEETTINTDLKMDIAGALTVTPDTTEVKVLLGRLQDSSFVRPQDLIRWLSYLLSNRFARDLTWKWIRDNWQWLETTFGGDKSYDYLPRRTASAFNTRKLFEEYKEFFGPKVDDLALTRNITMGIEEIENRVLWLERDAKAVTTYLKKFA